MIPPNWLQNRGGHVLNGYNNHIIDILQLKELPLGTISIEKSIR